MEDGKRLTRSAAKSLHKQSEGSSIDCPSATKRRRTMPTKLESPNEQQLEKKQSLIKEIKTERKQRRSSFVRGRSRKSIGVTNADVSEIHGKIPTDLSPEERLRLLHLACFEYTMNKLHEEFPILETMENFRSDGKKEFEKFLAELVEDGTLTAACHSSSRNENPQNLEIESHISQLNEKIQKLREESKQWDEILTSHTTKAEEEAVRTETQPLPLKEPDTLSVTQRKLLSELPGLEDVITTADKSQEKLALQVDELLKTLKQVQQFQESIDSFLSHKTNALTKESSQGFTDVDDPQELLKKSGI